MEISASLSNTHLSRNDSIVIITSLTMSAVFLVFLLRPIDMQLKSNLRVIAELTQESDQVKRKFSGTLSWSEVQSGSRLFQGDNIYTGDNSSAKIAFIKSKIIIKIPPKSLIHLEETDDEVSVDIKEGTAEITLKANSKLKVKHKGKAYNISSKINSQFSVSSFGGQIVVKTIQGKVFIDNSLKTIEANKDESIKIDTNSQMLKTNESQDANESKAKALLPKQERKLEAWEEKIMQHADRKIWDVQKIKHKK